eukprot:12081414-Alexandrium_andersonii.AAC.1
MPPPTVMSRTFVSLGRRSGRGANLAVRRLTAPRRWRWRGGAPTPAWLSRQQVHDAAERHDVTAGGLAMRWHLG